MLRTENRIEILAPPGLVFELAADILRWPDLLQHYRYVRLLEADDGQRAGRCRRVKMAASRSGIPVSWTSRQELYPGDLRILYHHVGGVTKGMDVIWRIEPRPGCVEVRIAHELDSPRWFLRSRLADFIVGRIFVAHIADKTLRGIKGHAEAATQESR